MSGATWQELMRALLSTENSVRQQAESSYEALSTEQKMEVLLSCLTDRSHGATDMKQLAAVMLRRLMTAEFDNFFPKLSAEQQNHLKQTMLSLLVEESDKNVRRKLADLVAEVARSLIDDNLNNLWPEILQSLFQMASSNEPAAKETALHLFSSVPTIFGNQENHYLDVIEQMLLSCLSDGSNPAVCLGAVKASVNFLLIHDNVEDDQAHAHVHKKLTSLLPHILNVTMSSVAAGEDEAALKSIIDLAENCPKFLRPQISQLFAACTKVFADAENTDDSWRHLALEVIVTLSETAPATVRKVVGTEQLGETLRAVLHMMTEVDDDDVANWATNDKSEDDDDESNAVVAESALDRLACGLGGKAVFQHIRDTTPTMLQNERWQVRHAALMAISASGEGCNKQMEAFLPQIMSVIINFVTDPHPRVRYACCNALGQMSTDFASDFQKKFHDKVVPGLLMLMDDHANPRVQAHAGAALVNFSEDCPKTVLAPYLEPILIKLEQILSSKFNELVEKGNKLVLEQVVTTIASVADTAEEKFAAFYDRFVPCLKYIIGNATTPELRLLRGKTIECISLIGLAVGPEKFMADAAEVMDLLLKNQKGGEQELADDDPQLSYMISAWARICKIMGPRFAPYLPVVMGPIMKTASIKPEVALLDNEELTGVESGNDGWEFVSLGEQQNFGIKTAGLEDKATACQMLVCYARELSAHFADYAEPVLQLMLPLLKFYFNDDVRAAAAESIAPLLQCIKAAAGIEYAAKVWQGMCCTELIKAIESEPESDVLAEMLGGLAACIELLGRGCLDADDAMAQVLKVTQNVLKEHFEKRMEREKARHDEDYDEAVEERLEEEDDVDKNLLARLADLIHAMFVAYREQMEPVFDQLLPSVSQLLDRARQWTDHQWGLCMFDDVIEHMGPRAAKYQQHFVDPMLFYLHDNQADVRQAAAYGWGVLGQNGGAGFAGVCANALPVLAQMIQQPGSRDGDNAAATENAIAAITKILKAGHVASLVNTESFLNPWLLEWLPVHEDVDEAPYVYGYLCDLVEGNHPLILANLPRVVNVVAKAFLLEALPRQKGEEQSPTEEVRKRLVRIVTEVQGNAQVFEACAQTLSDEEKQALSSAIASVQS